VNEVIASSGDGIPETVRGAVLARAARLRREARETLDAAAVLEYAPRAELWTEYSSECAAADFWAEAIRADHELIAIWRAEGSRLKEGWSLSFLVGCLTSNGRLAEAAWLAGDLPRVRDESRAVLDLALGHRLFWFAGELLFWLAQAGEPVEVPDWIARPFALQIHGNWMEAAAEWQRLGCPYEAAQALAGTGEPENLRAALAEYEALGAAPAAQLAKRRLREAGVLEELTSPRRGGRPNLSPSQGEERCPST
jgi:hypothetical protein